MKTAKECITCRHHSVQAFEYPCSSCCDYKMHEPMKPKKRQLLLKKYFLMWWKMSVLIYKIFILNRKCNKYPDLKKYRGNPKRKEKVWAKRDELKKAEKELKELI